MQVRVDRVLVKRDDWKAAMDVTPPADVIAAARNATRRVVVDWTIGPRPSRRSVGYTTTVSRPAAHRGARGRVDDAGWSSPGGHCEARRACLKTTTAPR
jgi:hypothetical protein